MAVLNFPVQKLIFGHFKIAKKWNLVKIIFREIDLFDFTSFFGLDFFNFLAHCDSNLNVFLMCFEYKNPIILIHFFRSLLRFRNELSGTIKVKFGRRVTPRSFKIRQTRNRRTTSRNGKSGDYFAKRKSEIANHVFFSKFPRFFEICG